MCLCVWDNKAFGKQTKPQNLSKTLMGKKVISPAFSNYVIEDTVWDFGEAWDGCWKILFGNESINEVFWKKMFWSIFGLR